MDEEALPPQERPDLEQFRDIRGLDSSLSPMGRFRRSMKRDESKETYKLPHRLIEKKRRDRINECIAQLKDLLPEHLKLTTLGHLEKAVVLELTVKHVKTLAALTEQQQHRIIALQNGDGSLKSPPRSDLEAFHAGFQTCAKEVLHHLAQPESDAGREQRRVQLLGHLHTVGARLLPGCPPLRIPKPWPLEPRPGGALKREPPPQPHCVPVIQRTQNWGKRADPQPPPGSPDPAGEPDTDTDSGYEGRKTPLAGSRVKREPAGDGVAPEGSKRRRLEKAGSPSAEAGVSGPRPALLDPRMALGAGGGSGGVSLGPSSPHRARLLALLRCHPVRCLPAAFPGEGRLGRLALPRRGRGGTLPFIPSEVE